MAAVVLRQRCHPGRFAVVRRGVPRGRRGDAPRASALRRGRPRVTWPDGAATPSGHGPRLAARPARQELLRRGPTIAFGFVVEEPVPPRHTDGEDVTREPIGRPLGRVA
ncbi:hypothetical protein GCM10010266_02000 [Streptomyces griseomycini]|nr:hypothetical protein GCM10010266_02000 [Streptomyces griseomycini]GGR02967.1 hypothetical protein GCM10015536_04960 [Streptomyces griseomycini]